MAIWLRMQKHLTSIWFPVTISVASLDGSRAERFQVNLSIPKNRVNNDDAWLLDVFPRIETVHGRLDANVQVSVSGLLEIVPAPTINTRTTATIEGATTINYRYNPVFQSFAAAFDQEHALWTFEKIGDEIKTGPIELNLLIAVSKDGRVATDKELMLSARIKATFTSYIFFGRSAETQGKIKVTF